jgi:uncharacterized protein (DUF2384 family)
MTSLRGDNSTPDTEQFWSIAAELFDELQTATQALAASQTVPEAVRGVVEHLVKVMGNQTPDRFGGADPYLVESLLAGTVQCAGVAWLGDPENQRRELRMPLERTRQALRDLLAERHVAADQPTKQVARWIVDITGVSQHELANLVGVGTRTLQRWLSDTEAAAPSGDEEIRMRTLARTIDQLRWSMTPVGVVRWLQRPHPALSGRSPVDLLGEPSAYQELPRLAAATRAMVAT